MGKIDLRLSELGITLPTPVISAGNYVPWVITGNLVHISGQGSVSNGKILYQGRVGESISATDAGLGARLAAINLIAHLRTACDGNLDRVKRIVRLFGLISSSPNFFHLPQVLDGASELMVSVFDEKGNHARYVGGVMTLPFGMSVTMELTAEIET